MAQSERERLLLFLRVIDDCGVAREAKEDALSWLEQHFQDTAVDGIAARDYLDRTVRPTAPHLWPRATPPPGTGVSLRGPDKPRRPQPRALTAAELKSLEGLSPTAKLTKAREMQQRPL